MATRAATSWLAFAATASTIAITVALGCGAKSGDRADAPPGANDGAAVVDAPEASADGGVCAPPVTPDAAPVTAAECTANSIPGSCLDVSTCYGSREPTAGLCPGSAAIECCTPRFAATIDCDPNAVPEPNACLAEQPGDAQCPKGMVRIDGSGSGSAAFCVDRYEGSLVEVVGSGASATTQPWSPYFPPTGHTVRAVSLASAVPQGYISQIEAGSACAAAGKRLCTDTEWLRACQGPSGTTYPYGNTREPGVCNDARSEHPAIELYGTTDSWIYSHLDSPCLNQEAAGLTPTGSHTGCITVDGAYDMMGNLHEWTADPNGTFRGGYYVDTVENGSGCLYATTAHDTSYSDYSTGFRCCADPVE